MLKALLTLTIAGAEIIRSAISGNMAAQSGQVTLEALDAPVIVERSAQGVPTIRAGSMLDAARAEGFLHAQDRFFQMDLMRRYSSGRIAEIMGEAGVGFDLDSRPCDFERRADALLQTLPAEHVRLIEAYTEGVNAGLAALSAPPFEYLALGLTPEAWEARDSILVGLSMFDMLAFGRTFERQRTTMSLTLPPALYEFLTPTTTRLDATLTEGLATAPAPVPIPGPEVIDLRGAATSALDDDLFLPVVRREIATGSNNLAVAGTRTSHGGAILSNDMHLQHSVPNTWYRIEIGWPGRTLRGVSLPGAPGIVAGSNGDIAWGFTNVTGDEQDFIVIEVDPDDPTWYRVPGGTEAFGSVTHTIGVRGREPSTLTLQTTRWGPVTERDARDRPLVMKWSATEPGGFNFGVFDLMLATSLEAGIEAAQRWCGPPQNVTIAAGDGRIGWTVSGYIPVRRGFDGSVATSWADGSCAWAGPLAPTAHPSIIDPPSGYIFTANNRTLPLEQSAVIGDHFMPPGRARRIAERLDPLADADERDILDVILDTRSLPHDAMRDLVLEITAEQESDERLALARRLAASWNGRADLDQRGFALLNQYHALLRNRLLNPLVRACREADSSFWYNWPLSDEVLLRLLDERPAHLLPAPWTDWRTMLRDTLARAVDHTRALGELDVPWGEVNTPAIQHPFSTVLPALSRFLDMPSVPLPGYVTTVRVQGWGFGASERLIVSPGRESRGILHMPAGQSGHPLSPYYRAGHMDWATGAPTPLVAPEVVSTLRLTP